MDGWHHHLTWLEFEPTLGRAGESGTLQSTGLQRIRHDWVTKQKGIIENVWGLVGRKPLYTWRIASELNITLFSHSLDNLFQLPSPPKWKSHETNLTGYIHCWVNKKVYVEIFKKVKQFINVTGYPTCLPCWKSNWLQKFNTQTNRSHFCCWTRKEILSMDTRLSLVPSLLLNGEHLIFVCQMQHTLKYLTIVFHRHSCQVRKPVMGPWASWDNGTQVFSVILISKLCPWSYGV